MLVDLSIPTAGARGHVVDLFAGPGGLDVAAHWLGLEAHGIEWDSNACATRTRAGLLTRQDDVRRQGPKDYPCGTVLTGGPPCQTFTVAGRGAGRQALQHVLQMVQRMAAGGDISAALAALEDERTGLVLEPLRWVLEAKELGRPYEAVVLEQVPAVEPIWTAIKGVVEVIGYQAVVGVLRTEEYGVPQTRRRAVLIARLGRPVRMPSPTHSRFRRGAPREVLGDDLRPWVSMGDVLTHRSAFKVVSNYGTGGDPKARGERTWDQPASTVTGKVSRNRVISMQGGVEDRLTHDEAGLLQTFPPLYPWAGKDVGQQIGNAIPPRLAVHVLGAALGVTVDDSWLDEVVKQPWRNPARRSIDVPCPPAPHSVGIALEQRPAEVGQLV